MLGIVTPRTLRLTRLSTKVVNANNDKPSGAEFARLRLAAGTYRPAAAGAGAELVRHPSRHWPHPYPEYPLR